MSKKNLERVFKALANERRLAIISLLKDKKELPVGEIAGFIKLSFRATSRHLSILYSADFLEREQRGLQIFYKISHELEDKIKQIFLII